MQCKRLDNIHLKQMQKMQMEEKLRKELEEKERDEMWHQVLIQNVKNKELKERLDFKRKQEEMKERRLVYDEQIASANKRRSALMKEERDKENRRLENIKRRMEEEHFEGMFTLQCVQ